MAKEAVDAMRSMGHRKLRSAYEDWVAEEGVPFHLTYGGTDITKIDDLAPWARMGSHCQGAFIINPDTWKGMCDGFLLVIDPKEEALPQRHLFEECVLILEGDGATTVSQGGHSQTFEWMAGDYFVLPLNCSYQHFNTGDSPVKLFSVTAAPLVVNYFHDRDFVFNNSAEFPSRFHGQFDYFNPSAAKQYKGPTLSTVMEANFIRNLAHIGLAPRPERGKSSTNLYFEGGDSTLISHASEMPAGSYKKGHRHLATGWFGLILRGEGYTLTWKEESTHYSEATEKKMIPWHEMCVLGYPDPWYHQHFNLSEGPSRYLAVHFGSQKYPGLVWVDHWKVQVSTSEGGEQVEYRDEDPYIMELYTAELAKRGLEPAAVSSWRE